MSKDSTVTREPASEWEGKAEFLSEGEYFDEMKEKFPFLNRVLQVNVESSKQLL